MTHHQTLWILISNFAGIKTKFQMLCTPNGIRTNSTRFTRMCRIVDWSEHSRKHSFLFIVWMCGECNHRKRYLKKTQLQNYVPWFSRFNDFATHLSPFHTFLYAVWDFIAIIVILSFLFTLTRTHMQKKMLSIGSCCWIVNGVLAEQQTYFNVFLCLKSSGIFRLVLSFLHSSVSLFVTYSFGACLLYMEWN